VTKNSQAGDAWLRNEQLQDGKLRNLVALSFACLVHL